MKGDDGKCVLTKRSYSTLLGVLGRTKIQYLILKFVFQKQISRLALASFLDFERQSDKILDIPHLTLPLLPYAQRRIQEQASQWILLHNTKMKLLGRQYHTNQIYLQSIHQKTFVETKFKLKLKLHPFGLFTLQDTKMRDTMILLIWVIKIQMIQIESSKSVSS